MNHFDEPFDSSSDTETFFPKETQARLKATFDSLPHDIPVYLFTRAGRKDEVSQIAGQLFESLQRLSDKIRFYEHDLDHPLAEKWKVDRSPTLLFDPEHRTIRYLGVPLGEEGITLIQTLILIGVGESGLSRQSRKVMARIDSPRHVRVFVSLTCPYCPEQAMNAIRAAMEKPELISVEIVDIQFNPDLAERFSAFSVPQVFSDDVLIAQGAQPEELFVLSLERMEQQTVFIPDNEAPRIETDLVIVGGGPAGLTAGIYAVRSGLRAVVVERGALGGQVATTPIVENYPGLTRVPGKSLVDIMVAHALEYAQIFPREEVLDIKPGHPIEVLTSRRQFVTRAVLLATGAGYKKLDVPGELLLSGRGVSYCSTCDGPLFKGKKVVVVGGGNSAVTEALDLHHIGASTTLIHRRDSLRAQEHLAKSLLDNGIPILWNTEVKEIRGKNKVEEIIIYNNKTQKSGTLPVDGVFIAVGYAPEVTLAKKIGVELTPDGFIRQENHRTNIPGIYAAGDVEGGYRQIVTATGQGAAAAMTVYEDLAHPYWGSEEKVEIGSTV